MKINLSLILISLFNFSISFAAEPDACIQQALDTVNPWGENFPYTHKDTFYNFTPRVEEAMQSLSKRGINLEYGALACGSICIHSRNDNIAEVHGLSYGDYANDLDGQFESKYEGDGITSLSAHTWTETASRSYGIALSYYRKVAAGAVSVGNLSTWGDHTVKILIKTTPSGITYVTKGIKKTSSGSCILYQQNELKEKVKTEVLNMIADDSARETARLAADWNQHATPSVAISYLISPENDLFLIMGVKHDNLSLDMINTRTGERSTQSVHELSNWKTVDLYKMKDTAITFGKALALTEEPKQYHCVLERVPALEDKNNRINFTSESILEFRKGKHKGSDPEGYTSVGLVRVLKAGWDNVLPNGRNQQILYVKNGDSMPRFQGESLDPWQSDLNIIKHVGINALNANDTNIFGVPVLSFGRTICLDK